MKNSRLHSLFTLCPDILTFGWIILNTRGIPPPPTPHTIGPKGKFYAKLFKKIFFYTKNLKFSSFIVIFDVLLKRRYTVESPLL
jgi:hypothetical protein